MPRALALVALALAYVPLLFLGPGTDLDTGGVYAAGQAILDGDYVPSRAPGAPVFEAVAAVLHLLGGSALVNAVSLVMALLTARGVEWLLDEERVPMASWFGLAVLINPFVLAAGTSMIEHIWTLAALVAGAVALRSGRGAVACAAFIVAAGCRLPAAALVIAIVLVSSVRGSRQQRASVAIVAAWIVGTVLLYIPSWMALGASMFDATPPASTLTVLLGRFGVKNLYFFGPVVVVLVGLHARPLVRALRQRWAESFALRVGVALLVATELLFLRFPLKLAHLLPAFVGLVLVIGASRTFSRGSVVLLAVSQVILGVVALNIADPDRPDAATGGRFRPSIEWGPLVREVDCRLESDKTAYRRGITNDALRETWACVVPWSNPDS